MEAQRRLQRKRKCRDDDDDQGYAYGYAPRPAMVPMMPVSPAIVINPPHRDQALRWINR